MPRSTGPGSGCLLAPCSDRRCAPQCLSCGVEGTEWTDALHGFTPASVTCQELFLSTPVQPNRTGNDSKQLLLFSKQRATQSTPGKGTLGKK